MAFQPSGEYYFDGSKFPRTVLMPAEETEDWAIRLKNIGIVRYVAVSTDGSISEMPILDYRQENKYIDALQTIRDLESRQILMEGSYIAALNSLADDEFETSQWATYMPNPEAEEL